MDRTRTFAQETDKRPLLSASLLPKATRNSRGRYRVTSDLVLQPDIHVPMPGFRAFFCPAHLQL